MQAARRKAGLSRGKSGGWPREGATLAVHRRDADASSKLTLRALVHDVSLRCGSTGGRGCATRSPPQWGQRVTSRPASNIKVACQEAAALGRDGCRSVGADGAKRGGADKPADAAPAYRPDLLNLSGGACCTTRRNSPGGAWRWHRRFEGTRSETSTSLLLAMPTMRGPKVMMTCRRG